MRRSWPVVIIALTAVLASLNLSAAASPSIAGTDDLVNFEHVFNFPFPTGSPTAQGSDIEFYSSTVALRDENGQKILDPEGNEVLAERDFAVVGAYDRGAFIFDITDPEAVRFVSLVECRQRQNNPELKRFGNRWVLGLTVDGGQTCISPRHTLDGSGDGALSLFDVTDPYAWSKLYSIKVLFGGHTFTFHPTLPYGWVSSGEIPGNPRVNILPIVNFSDLLTPDPSDTPTLVRSMASVGSPHDLSFSDDGSRAYVSDQHNFKIFDSSDPSNPTLLSTVGVSPGTYAHTSEVTPDGRIMVGTEESLALGGFFVPQTGVCPGEGLVFYNVQGPLELAPVPMGYFLADVVGQVPDQRACTGHQYEIAANSRVLVVGWYIGGVRVVDFSNPAAPREVGRAQMADGEVWAARFHKGPYVFTGDQTRGFDVFRWSGTDPAPWLVP